MDVFLCRHYTDLAARQSPQVTQLQEQLNKLHREYNDQELLALLDNEVSARRGKFNDTTFDKISD
jgi:hypothetical protein